MGSEQPTQKPRGGRKLGKVDASLNEKLQSVEWGEFLLKDLFKVISSKKIYHASHLETIFASQVKGSLPYVVRTTQQNGVRGYIIEDKNYANDAKTLSFAQDTFSVFYQKQNFFTGNKVKILKPKFTNQNENIMQYITICFQKALSHLSWGTGSTVDTIKNIKIQLPVKNGEIDFEFMENFVAELEAHLTVAGLKNYTLTTEEQQVLSILKNNKIEWKEYNLKKLFGDSTRGKRLKSSDRIKGNLPFVTAGEANTGISAFIGNSVEIFKENTITIDMFGSAKYRNYKYGGDDHIAVVHTENLNKYASIFVTSSIHKSSHNGQFNYGRNFYAKDADELNIQLPTKNNKPDYEIMELLVSAIQKEVIKDVVLYTDKKIEATKKVINK